MDRQTARDKARELVNQMTVEEAASQLSYNAPAIPRLELPAYNWWNEALHGVARAGTATVFPQAIGLAAMFDAPFLHTIAEVIAVEARAKFNAQSFFEDRDIYKGLTFWSPNVNIFRDPRWGRGHETYGEDPFLTARLGCAFVVGLQGDGQYLKGAACAKHYAVHSGPEALRHEFDARVSEKDMAETYLPAFEALVTEAGVEAVMGAYNRVNGEPACGSKVLLQDILRGEWRFEGHVVSDCWAIADFHTHHGVTATAVESAALALRRGCDLNCGHTYLHLIQALKDGLVTEEDIRLSAVRLMTTRYLLGLFDPHCEYHQITYDQNDTRAHHDLALQAAERSMVLLKNDGLLPLDLSSIKTIGVIGPNADSVQVLEGNYCGTSSRYITFLRGIQDACEGKARLLYAQGCHLHKDSTSGLCLPDDRLSEALAVCAASDVVILCVGLDASLEGEEGDTGNPFYSGDKNDLELPGVQRRLIKAVLSSGKPVVTLLGAGSSVCAEEGNAVLLTWYPGQAGGTAAANILFGKCSPSGKLPVTFYRWVEDLPAFEDYSMKNRTYRYFKGEPLYPFGYGLTYTNVTVNSVRAETEGCETRVWVSLENKGPMNTEEVIQLYIKDETSPFAPPNPVLCAFKRVFLKAGESGEFMLTTDHKAFTVVDDDGKRRLTRGGLYSLYAGLTQPDPRSEQLTGTAPVKMQVTLCKNVGNTT